MSQSEKQKFFEEQGFYLADTPEEASSIAGYNIAVPTYIPEGFSQDAFMISHAVVRPGETRDMYRPEDFIPSVEMSWRYKGYYANSFILNESTVEMIGGHQSLPWPGEKDRQPARQQTPPQLSIIWTDGKRYYAFLGDITRELDENTLVKIAESIHGQ